MADRNALDQFEAADALARSCSEEAIWTEELGIENEMETWKDENILAQAR